MSYLQEWNELIENQTDDTFAGFWESYSNAEKHIYGDILKNKTTKITGTFKEAAEKYDVDPVLFMGFMDGINSSLKKEIDLETINDDSNIDMELDFEKLYYNMYKAEAEHLYSLPQWRDILPGMKREEIEKEYKKSKTVVKDKTPGRNDPCPCGSGKKYKKCCGKAV